MKKQKPLKKRSAKLRGKRPKSVMRKVWATRRAKKLTFTKEEINAAAAKLVPELNTLMYGDTAQDNQPKVDWQPMADGIARTIELHRDEQLLSFMGDMAAGRQNGLQQGHYPFIVSRTQVEAIEQFLLEHGYSAWGKRGQSGSASEVSKAA